MRILALIASVALLALPAHAQQEVSEVPVAGAGEAQATGMTSEQLAGQLQQLLRSQTTQQALGQGIAVASLMGCTSKTVGKPATDAFYAKMKAVGDQVAGLCKQGKKEEARTTVLAAIKTHRNNSVAMAATNCHSHNKANFDQMAGEPLASDTARYASWIRDPRRAEREMTAEDVCK